MASVPSDGKGTLLIDHLIKDKSVTDKYCIK